MLARYLMLAVMGVAFVVCQGRADSWLPPTPRIFANQWGSHGLKVLPDPKKMFEGPAEAILFTLDATGGEQILWKARLVNLPHRVLLTPTGKHLVTIDTYGSLGYRHAVVIYNERGQALGDFALEDLLTAAELNSKVMKTTSSRHWTDGAQFNFTDDLNSFEIALKWGRTIRFDLNTGKLR